jgi:hypothetical protein
MNNRLRIYSVNFAAVLLAVALTLGLIVLIWSLTEPNPGSYGSPKPSSLVETPDHPRLAPLPWSQSSQKLDSEYNILELPKASLDFVGSWGGYTHDIEPSEVESPDHVSVVFGRRGNTAFFATKLYSPSGQRILGRPRARITNPKQVLVMYSAQDEHLDYAYSHRFTLLDSGKIAYEETVELYDRRTGQIAGTDGQHALLERLTTAPERRVFALPSSRDVFKGQLFTSEKIRGR